MKPLILIIFLLVTILDSCFYGLGLQEYRYYFGPLIIPSILIYYLISTKKKNPLLLIAIFFVWLGDLLLLIELSPAYLQWAVFFYWMMQLSFIVEYLKYFKGYTFRSHFLGLLFYGSYLVVFMNHVYGSLGEMKIHGLIYGVTLSAFGSVTIMNLLHTASKKNILLFIGLLIFSVRDVFLTYNKKYFNEDVFTFSIPILHGIGFFIIIQAFLYFEEDYYEDRLKIAD
ncbi:lysoplasmalogenase family protein [Flavobacteriaceae bacterium]|nr:lysoplasmalogenase family protein [Flavobacteriaceae bacterium]MDA9572188.1 lysoplasmalogenase family protein [Flavobacteriaceae bacterium]MDB3863047.1 lysoplasmalogenase family protein [Flavobacteriaceae bacterium]